MSKPLEQKPDVRADVLGLLQEAQEKIGQAFSMHKAAEPEERHALINSSAVLDAAQYLVTVRGKVGHR